MKAYIVEPMFGNYSKRCVFTDYETAKKYAKHVKRVYEMFKGKYESKFKVRENAYGKVCYLKCWKAEDKENTSFYLCSISELEFKN